MDAKDLRTQPTVSDRSNEGTKYAQSGIVLQCDRNKTYQDIGSNSLAKVEVQNARPCAVIGPDRIIPPPVANEAYLKKASAEPWPCADNTYRRPPEYPRKLSGYSNPIRNISPRQTYQENMQRIMVPATYNSIKINDDTNYAQNPDRNAVLSKNIKLNVPPESKYCDVPYAVNPNSSEPKNVRNSEMCVSNVNPSLSRTAPHGWPPSGVNLRSSRPYGAPELYQYQDYPSCAGPRPVMPRAHRAHPEEAGYMYADSYYPEGNIRFKPYPTVKERFPPARYDYIGNYANPFHPPSSYPPHKYDFQKSMPPHPFPSYGSVKYLDNRVPEPILDGYQRNHQGNYNSAYSNQVIHPNYGPVIGNCSQSKMHPFPPDSNIKTIAPNKLPYDNNTKSYVEYDNSRPKIYPPSDSYLVSEMGRLHQMKNQVLMSNYSNLNIHSGPPNPYYKKENTQMKNYDYMAHFRNMDPTMNVHSPILRHGPMFSPNTLAISPTDSSVSNDTNQTLGTSQEDCGYVSQSSNASVRSMDSGISRLSNDYYRRYYESRYAHLVRTSPMMMKTDLLSNSNSSKDKKNIDVRQFLQMWNEGDDETEDPNSKEVLSKIGSSDDHKLTKKQEGRSDQEQLYVLGLVNVPSEELSKYEHLQTVSKLPENIKGYNNIELLKQFEEAIESSSMNNFKTHPPKDNYQKAIKVVPPKQVTGIQLPRPVSPLDVEAKISQSVIHKEVGCNFEIKPCSPKMLNVEIAAPVQNILSERVIEKVANPVSVKSPMLGGIEENRDCNLMARQDHRLNMNDNVRIASCKMISNQYSDINPIDPIKSTYTLHDLESNSGLCLASLPRLDNDIELNFPEVNQQFINANRGESGVLTDSVKDLPTLEILDQPDNEIEEKDTNAQVLGIEHTTNNSLSNTDGDKEMTKLSKYRKNKINPTEDHERKSVFTKEDQKKNNQIAIRTDSVIIKNPDNVKKYDDCSVFPTNCFNELQQAPMNLTTQINFEEESKGGCNIKDEKPHSTDIAIDFSLNKSNLVTDYKPNETEMKIQKDHSPHEHTNITDNRQSYHDGPSKLDKFKQCDFGNHDTCMANSPVENSESSVQAEDKINLNQDIKKYTTDDFNIGKHEGGTDVENANEEHFDKSVYDEENLKAESYIVEPLAISNNSSDHSKITVPRKKALEEPKNLNHMDTEPCKLQNGENIDITEKTVNNICNLQNQIKETILQNEEIEKETHGAGIDSENSGTVISLPKDTCEINLSHEECNNNFDPTISLEIENFAAVNPQISPLRDDISDEDVPSCDEIRDNIPLSNSVKYLQTKGDIFCDPEACIPDTETRVRNTRPLIFHEKGTYKGTIFWSKKIFSPTIQNLLTFCEGNINMKKNVEIISGIITKSLSESSVASLENSLCVNQIMDSRDDVDNLQNINPVTDKDVIGNGHMCNSNPSDSLDNIESLTEIPDAKSNANTTDEHNILRDKMAATVKCDEVISTNTESSNIDLISQDLNDGSLHKTSELHDDVPDLPSEHCVKNLTGSFENPRDDDNMEIILDDAGILQTSNLCDHQIENIDLKDCVQSEKTSNMFHENKLEVQTENAKVIEDSIIFDDHRKLCHTIRADTKFKRKQLLKRSLSDSALHDFVVNQKENEDDVELVLPLKRTKVDNIEDVDLCSIFQHNRRNSISAIYNEDNVSFCILIDNGCIIAEEEENEEQSICYSEFSEECLKIQNEPLVQDDVENTEVHPVTSSPEINVVCEYSDSYSFDCEVSKELENSWVEDVACVETVISDDIAADIVIGSPPSPKVDDLSENDESGVFTSSEHTDKVKFIYGDKMCSDDAQYLETLYNTPQMDVNKALISRDVPVCGECVKYYDKDSLEKVLSESTVREPYTEEFISSIIPLSISNSTPDEKENVMNIFSSLHNNLNCEDVVKDIKINHVEQENSQPVSSFNQTQDKTVHSCESSIDNVFTYMNEEKEESTNFTTSSSPEVSSTTSEEKNSGILLKITNYKGSRISQINGISSINNGPSCKFTEEKEYLHSSSIFSKNRPLLTKAAQKYIPPLKESIRDLKVKLTLPTQSLMKLKQLKKSKDVPKPVKQVNNNIPRIPKKPKLNFEDVLMSIDEIQFQKHKEKKKAKKSIPKVVIKKSQNGSHYASTSNKDEFNPDLTGRKWQPWVFLEKNTFIDKMAIKNKTKAIYSHRKKNYVLTEKFKKYKAVNSAKFVISQPKTDNHSTGLKYTIRLKHNY